MRVGERASRHIAESYQQNPLHSYAEEFVNVASMIREGALDLYNNPITAINSARGNDALMNFFIENSFDANDPMFTPEKQEDFLKDMEALYMNDREGVLEHTTGTDINPLIGMTFPLHKWILMNMVFDKGGIPKVVAESPKFTISQETRILIDTNGNEIDMFYEQNAMTPAIDATILNTTFDVTLPLTEATEIVHDKVGGLAGVDHLAIETNVAAVKVKDVLFEVGDTLPNDDGYIVQGGPVATEETTKDVWVKVKYTFTPGYYGNEVERTLIRKFVYKYKKKVNGEVVVATFTDQLSGSMNKDRITLNSMNGDIKEVRINAMLDPSNARATTCSVAWKQYTIPIEIGNAIPINCTISPEETKDISLLYNVNQVTKIMSMFKTVLGNYKDDKILQNINESYESLDKRWKTWNEFDYSPRVGYAHDHIQWRKDTFLDFLDSEVTILMQALNDPNMTVTIYGDPDLVRKITPATYSYQSPGSVGAVDLDFTKTVYTSDKRLYNFIGSDKLRNTTDFILILCPNNTDRILYRIYDYQLYLSNEIRNANNPSLPALHSFERWKFVEYTPVQGRIHIKNPRGINADTYNAFPVQHVD